MPQFQLLDADANPAIGFDVTDEAYDAAEGGGVILTHEGKLYVYYDATADFVQFSPATPFQLVSHDGGETYSLMPTTGE